MKNVNKIYIIEQADTKYLEFSLHTIFRKDHAIWSRIRDINGIYDFDVIDYKAIYKIAKCFIIEEVNEEIKVIIKYFIKMQKENE